MSGPNAYCCTQCGRVDMEESVSYGGGDWLEMRPLSHVLDFGGKRLLRTPAAFCSPICAREFLSRDPD